MKWLAVAAIIVAMPCAANAEDAGQGYGLGMNSCAEFARSYAANPTMTEDAYFTWAQGFMSGLNLSAIAAKLIYRKIDGGNMTTQKMQVRSYCDAHPLTTYAAAIAALYASFPAARSNSN